VIATFDNMIGVPNLKRMAQRDIAASKATGEVFPHTGLFGPAGLGKTTFARCMAHELRSPFLEIEAAAIRNRDALIRMLKEGCDAAKRHNKNLVAFIDEAHRLGVLQEVLFYLLPDFYVTTTGGRIDFHPFTLVAATTNPNMLMTPFLTRLQNKWYMEPYSLDHVRRLVHAQLQQMKLDYDFLIVDAVAKRSLGNPRVAGNLCKKLRNTVLAKGRRRITDADCREMFSLEEIDDLGLNKQHVQYLVELLKANGVPKGLSALSGKLGLDEDVVAGSVEPALLQLGFVDSTSRGRILTPAGHLHLAQTGLA
jgi:Holliday junction DNA helicase RuvB